MPPRQEFRASFLLLLLAAPAVSSGLFQVKPSWRTGPWIEAILLPPADNQSMPLVCDYSQQAWARSAIRVNINGTQFKAFNGLEPCAQTRTKGISSKLKLVKQKAKFPLRVDDVVLPFRRHTFVLQEDFICDVYAGTFIWDSSSLYAVIASVFNVSALHLTEIIKRPALIEKKPFRFYGNVTMIWFNTKREWRHSEESLPESREKSVSLFSRAMDEQNVPDYERAIDEAHSHLSTYQERLNELSRSNTAILLLPMFLSFLPASAFTDDSSPFRTLMYAIATDFLTNIPVLIMGAELLHLSLTKKPGTGLASLRTDDVQVQFFEIWFTECNKKLPSFRIAFIFVFLGIWSMAVGFTTEYLVWKSNAEKRAMGLIDRSNHFGSDSQSRSTFVEKGDGEPFRKRFKMSHSFATKDASRDLISDIHVRKRRHSDMVSKAGSNLGSDDNYTNGSNWKGDVKEYSFFVVGAVLSFVAVIPFLGFAFLKHSFFKKTEQRERFFILGTIVGSINLAYIFADFGLRYAIGRLFFFPKNFCFLIIVLLLDLFLPFVLGQWSCKCFTCLPMICRGRTEPGKEGIHESRATRFYFLGLLLGLLLSILSPFYLHCFPWIRGYKRRREMLKIGFVIGAKTNFLFLAFFLGLLFRNFILIILLNLVFIGTLILSETVQIVCTTQNELKDMI